MPRGGARIGAGRKPKDGPKSEKLLKPARMSLPKPTAPTAFAVTGEKTPETPVTWPFGTVAIASDEVRPASSEPLTALALFQQIYRDESVDIRTRLGAAAQALPYESARPVALGKKETRQEAAKKSASRFAPSAPPRLVAASGKPV